ncbi:MAG: hypothetical protein ACK6DZ_14520 [Acidobacteriota bacterium]
MDGDRKYSQHGYQDSDRGGPGGQGRHDERPRHQGPKPPIDVTGPRLPRLVQSVAASRCWNCSTMLMDGIEFDATCPKCSAALHCCKQCTHFEPSTRFQCLKPVPERINKKDQPNQCTFFKQRVTVARDNPGARPAGMTGLGGGQTVSRPIEQTQGPRNSQEARAAFDSLFKK